MLKKVIKTIEDYSMLEQGDHLLVAVSGGPDSVALLRILVLLSSRYQLHLTTAHLNHGLRGQEAEKEADFVRRLCAGMAIACICKTVDIRVQHAVRGKSLEEIGREERYRFLYETAEICGAQKIATGHHRDDQAETVLINLIRGCGPKGMKGISPVRDGRIIRPLLRVRRNEILEFLDREGLTYMLDSSNLSPIFLRNRIRNHLIPDLKARYNPRIVTGLCNLSEIMRREDDYWQITVQQILQQWRILPGALENLLPVNAFLDLHEALQGRIIKFLLEAFAPLGRGIGYRHIESVLTLLRGPHNCRRISIDLPWQISVEREEKILRIRKVIRPRQARGGGEKRKNPPQGFSHPVEIPGIVYLPEIQKSICFEFVEEQGVHEMKSQSRAAFLDYEKLFLPLILRSMKPGDRIAPLGMTGMKKLKSYFIDRKIPSSDRRMIPLLVDKKEMICWIANERINDRLKVTENTRKVLKAEMV